MTELIPAFKQHPQAIVFSTDDNYAKYLGVTLKSLTAHADAANFYDIVVLDSGISDFNKDQLAAICAGKSNISLRFYDISELNRSFQDRMYSSAYFTLAMYYRLFIPDIFAAYEKALYLDCDLVVTADVQELLNQKLGKYALGAVTDESLMPENRGKNQAMERYLRKNLNFSEPENYFNSGVLLFDLAKPAAKDLSRSCMNMLKDRPNLWFPDQDLLNLYFLGNYKKLDKKWNFQWALMLHDYQQKPAVLPHIIHYTSAIKPWNTPNLPLAAVFWQYARQTELYEAIVYDNISSKYQRVIRLLNEKTTLKANYWIYKLLSKLALGKKAKEFDQLKKNCKNKLKEFKSILE